MRTYSATRAQTFVKLRAPASAPFFFASMKIGAAAALVGAIVAEVTKSEDGGLGARLLAGSYYGQTVQIWAALFAARRSRPPSSGSSAVSAGSCSDGWPSSDEPAPPDLSPPLLFGPAVLALWEAVVRLGRSDDHSAGASAIAAASSPPCRRSRRISSRRSRACWRVLRSARRGPVVAILIDRSPFLQRGLLPIGNFVSALPIVGIAPIMVMWFGFDWHSKAAVVVVMTFFPMLVNAIAGLSSAGSMERDLMKTYAADYWQTLLSLRLPAALPFIFTALKINTTLAMIGAIVAEFFGMPIVGMGFRISTEVGHLSIDMVWATIVVAALDRIAVLCAGRPR